MGYYLQAIIGRLQTLRAHAADFRYAQIIPLSQDVAMIPLTDELHEEFGSGDEPNPFEKLSPAVEQWAQGISSASPIAYVEAEFFGGVGGQSAVVWSGRSQVLGPVHAQDAINQALRLLGVQIGAAHDEFAAVGLGRHRNTRDWILEQT